MPPESSAPPVQRLVSLYAYRGFVMLLMLTAEYMKAQETLMFEAAFAQKPSSNRVHEPVAPLTPWFLDGT